MNLLAGASALGGVFKGATSLVQALKTPKLTGEQFAEILNRQIEMHRGGASASTMLSQSTANALSDKFLALRDADGDLRLRVEESGLDPVKFVAMDADRDGYLTVQELRAYAGANPVEAGQLLK
ncbi:MAG: hypothetical protein RLZZ303_1027 [Candidatus Hydrogenedentota bacterium]|jgi:hypothetical protein